MSVQIVVAFIFKPELNFAKFAKFGDITLLKPVKIENMISLIHESDVGQTVAGKRRRADWISGFFQFFQLFSIYSENQIKLNINK